MLETRYEEYAQLEASQTFVLHSHLRRSQRQFSDAMNWHENLELQVCTAGQGSVLLDGHLYPFGEGDVVVVNSNVLHYTHTDTSLTYSALIVSTAFCHQMGLDYEKYTFRPVIRDEALWEALQQLLRLHSAGEMPMKAARLNALLLQALILLGTSYATIRSHTQPPKAPETVKAAVRYIQEHYADKLSLDLLARQVYADKYVLSRAFRRYTGKTVVEFITHYRCQRAATLILSGSSVSEAAGRCGYDNLSFFTKTFKAQFGVLPSSLKKSQ